MQISVNLGVRDVGTTAIVSTRKFVFWSTERSYTCFGGGPIRGGQWADSETGEEVGPDLEYKLNRAAQAAVRRRCVK